MVLPASHQSATCFVVVCGSWYWIKVLQLGLVNKLLSAFTWWDLLVSKGSSSALGSLSFWWTAVQQHPCCSSPAHSWSWGLDFISVDLLTVPCAAFACVTCHCCTGGGCVSCATFSGSSHVGFVEEGWMELAGHWYTWPSSSSFLSKCVLYPFHVRQTIVISETLHKWS